MIKMIIAFEHGKLVNFDEYDEHDKQIRVDAIDEFWKEFDRQIKSNGKQTYFYTEFLRLGMNLVEQLKEPKNE